MPPVTCHTVPMIIPHPAPLLWSLKYNTFYILKFDDYYISGGFLMLECHSNIINTYRLCKHTHTDIFFYSPQITLYIVPHWNLPEQCKWGANRLMSACIKCAFPVPSIQHLSQELHTITKCITRHQQDSLDWLKPFALFFFFYCIVRYHKSDCPWEKVDKNWSQNYR